MGFYYFSNGTCRYVERYDPLPGDERPRKRKYPDRSSSCLQGWW